jgi:hypothetical protein
MCSKKHLQTGVYRGVKKVKGTTVHSPKVFSKKQPGIVSGNSPKGLPEERQ